MNEIRKWVEEQKNAWLEDAMKLIRIKSVSEPGSHPVYPYGEGCAKVLDAALALAESMGFETENHEYQCGSVLLRGETDEEIGIFCHLDVVHEGDGWPTPPYEPYADETWLYGRGSQDNKGPLMTALYAMKYLKDHNAKLKHTIRLYMGCSEELGMTDIIYYAENYKLPEFSFVADCGFTVCYAEKGILEAEFSRKLDSDVLRSFEGGVSGNAVPGVASAKLLVENPQDLAEYVSGLENADDFIVEWAGKMVEITAKGRPAHAAFPEGSDGAIVKLAKMLRKSPFLDNKAMEGLAFVDECFDGYYGEGMQVTCEDEITGKLTLVGGTVLLKDGRLVQSINVRYPATADQEWLIAGIRKAVADYGWEEDWLNNNKANMFDVNDPKIQVMVDTFEKVTGIEDCPPYTMGGGTYARKLPNAVGFGPCMRPPYRVKPAGMGNSHQINECTHIGDQMNGMEIYIRVLPKIDEMV